MTALTIWHIFAVALTTLGVGCTVLFIITGMINKRIDDTNAQLAEIRSDIKEILSRTGQADQARRA